MANYGDDNRALNHNQAIVAGVLWEVKANIATATFSDGSYSNYYKGDRAIPTEVEHLFNRKTRDFNQAIEIEFEGKNVGNAVLSSKGNFLTILIDDVEMIDDIINSRVIFARTSNIAENNKKVDDAIKVLIKHFKGVIT